MIWRMVWRMHWRALAAVLVVTMAPLARAADSPTTAIDNCILQLDPEVDVGYERIAAICPRLAQALEQSGFAQWLPRGWKESRNNLSAGSLAELRAVVERELATRPATRVPNVEHLNDVLAGLGNQHVQTSGAWARFKKWLRDLMERRERPTDQNWFDRMVSRGGVSAAVGEVLTYIALGAVVVLALIVVFNELKAAGLLGRRRTEGNEESESGSSTVRIAPTMGDIEKAPLIERPAMLLELIASKLTTMGRLPPASALTVREMQHSAHLQDEQDRARLSALALTTERARFAQENVPTTVLEQAVSDGRALFESVSNLAAGRESAPPGVPTR